MPHLQALSAMRDKYFYLDFTSCDRRFPALKRFFSELKQAKETFKENVTKGYDLCEDPKWIELLDSEARDWFADAFDLESEEGKTYLQLWDLTNPSLRFTHPIFNLPGNWDLDSMLDSIFNCEYRPIDVILESPGNGVLYYEPLAGPFGGTESLVELLRAFGNTVTYDSWNEGPFEPPEVGWDYPLAKQLVAQNKGIA